MCWICKAFQQKVFFGLAIRTFLGDWLISWMWFEKLQLPFLFFSNWSTPFSFRFGNWSETVSKRFKSWLVLGAYASLRWPLRLLKSQFTQELFLRIKSRVRGGLTVGGLTPVESMANKRSATINCSVAQNYATNTPALAHGGEAAHKGTVQMQSRGSQWNSLAHDSL